jgi:uncharacterized membrane protein
MSASSSKAATTKIVYILYLIGIVMPILTIIGLVMAYINMDDREEWLRSHYRFQIRTFWIGLLLSTISSLLTLIIIGWPLLIATGLWFIVRCVKGLKFLAQQQTHPNALTWMTD